MKDYSGPASLQRPSASASIIDMYRSALGAICRRLGGVGFGPEHYGD